MNTVILTKVKVKLINDFNLTDRASNKLRYDAIRYGAVYVCDGTHDEILETIFSREELRNDELILEVEVEISDDESVCNKNNIFICHNYLCLIINILNH